MTYIEIDMGSNKNMLRYVCEIIQGGLKIMEEKIQRSVEPSLELVQVNKKIGSKHIIKDVSFEVFPGEVFGFLGPNGAGKTTTIRMLVGLTKISSGKVYIQGHDIEKEHKNAMEHVGAIVENPEMYNYLTGYQNLKHYARMHGGITKERIDEVVKLVRLGNRIHDKVKKYSLGMKQRLGIAQALLHKPSLLILDEPTNGLDPAGIHEIRDYIRRLAREEGMAVVVSSHILSEMELMCDRIGIIKNGKVVDVQKTNELGDHDQSIIIEAKEVEPLLQLLEQHFEIKKVDGNEVTIVASRQQIPPIIKACLDRNIVLYQIYIGKSSLEERFLSMTKDEEGVQIG
mgnify:FL=1